MELLINGLLIAATLFAGSYCWVLARRVRDLKSLDKGLGKSIVTLTRQVELARMTLEESRNAAKLSRSDLSDLIAKANDAALKVDDATRSAHDAERGLRYQIAQAAERRRAIAAELEAALAAEADMERRRAAARRAEMPAESPAEKPETRPAERAASFAPEPVPQAPPAPIRQVETAPHPPAADVAEASELFARPYAAGDMPAEAVEPRAEAVAPGMLIPKPTPLPGVEAGAESAAEDAPEAIPEPRSYPTEPVGPTHSKPPVPPKSEDVEPWTPKRAGPASDLLSLNPLRPRAAKVTELPKPKLMPPLGNPLRTKLARVSFNDEDELLEALSQLAAGGKR
jgi:hypothetical protein